MYSHDEVIAFVAEENISFIRLAFCDVKGVQKNIAIMPSELNRAFTSGIPFDASAIEGFEDAACSDLLLRPDPSTLVTLPWRPGNGPVVRMFCDIEKPDGSPFILDNRRILKDAVQAASDQGISCTIGTDFEFYLFKTDENGNPTITPYDNASYLDIAPLDRGENIRREICFTLQDMGIAPQASHHEEGPGQQEIDFQCADPLTAADNAITFQNVVKTVAMANGAYADFSPKPLNLKSGSGMHINISVSTLPGPANSAAPGLGCGDLQDAFMAGVMKHIKEITLFLNPTEDSFRRLGEKKAPRYITWSHENQSHLIRVPAFGPENHLFQLRSPDPSANPYIAFAALIYAGLGGIMEKLIPPAPTDLNLLAADIQGTKDLERLPSSLEEARTLAKNSLFLREIFPQKLLAAWSLDQRFDQDCDQGFGPGL